MMIELPADPGIVRSWIVCETGDRWLSAVRRFGPAMMPSPLLPAIVSSHPSDALGMLTGPGPAVVLWEVRRESLAAACDCLAQTATTAPAVLQLVALDGISEREQILLSEFQPAAAIRQPEDLPRLAAMIRGYFATSRQNLD